MQGRFVSSPAVGARLQIGCERVSYGYSSRHGAVIVGLQLFQYVMSRTLLLDDTPAQLLAARQTLFCWLRRRHEVGDGYLEHRRRKVWKVDL